MNDLHSSVSPVYGFVALTSKTFVCILVVYHNIITVNTQRVIPNKWKILFGFCKQTQGFFFLIGIWFFLLCAWWLWQLVTNFSAMHRGMLGLLEDYCFYLWESILFLEMSLFWIYCKLLLIQIYKVVWHKHPELQHTVRMWKHCKLFQMCSLHVQIGASLVSFSEGGLAILPAGFLLVVLLTVFCANLQIWTCVRSLHTGMLPCLLPML